MSEIELFNWTGLILWYLICAAFIILTLFVVMILPIKAVLYFQEWITLKALSNLFGSIEEFERVRNARGYSVRFSKNFNSSSNSIDIIETFLKRYHAEKGAKND